MIGLRVEAEAARLLARGAVAVVLAPGATLPPLPPLLALEWHGGTLLRPGAEATRLAPLPAESRLLALVAPDRATAARITPLLPAGVTPVIGGDPLAALLRLMAMAVAEMAASRAEAEAARDAAIRVLGHRPGIAPRLMLDVPPDPAARAPARVRQPFGRPAEGVCAIALHLTDAGCGAGSLLRVRLLVEEVIRGAWIVLGGETEVGWLTLDLPEPLRTGAAEVVIEVAAEVAEGDRLALSASGAGAAPLALRAWTAPAGRYVMPRHADWAALGSTPKGVPYAVPLDGVEAEGAETRLIGLGDEAAKLLVDVPGGSAVLALPPLPAGPAELLRLDITRVSGDADVALSVGTLESGWRSFDADGALTLTLPLPAAPSRAHLHLRGGPTTVELSRLALLAGLTGERRDPPAAEAPHVFAPVRAAGSAFAVALPGSGFRTAPPQPPPVPASPGAVPAQPAGAAGGVSFQDVSLQQHLVSPDGGYRHLDLVVSGLVASVGLWRQVRTKLFDRRGIVGLEFREAKGWPQMFDTWPAGKTDGFGPFWRLETEEAATQLACLVTPHDRALIAALLAVLPDLAARASAADGLDRAETEAWSSRARRLAEVVAEARGRIS